MAKDGGCSVSLVSVDEHAWDDAVPVEGLTVDRVCVGLTRVGGGIEPPILGEFGFCEFFELAWIYFDVLIWGVVEEAEEVG
jgi:hypothetical protein